MLRFLSILLLFLLAQGTAWAQSAQDVFGKNRVQYKKMEWMYISTANFDVYYDKPNAELAANAVMLAEQELARIMDLTGYRPYSRIKILLYASPEHMMQSNRELEMNNAFTGGQTRLVKARLELAFRGSYEVLRKDMAAALGEMAVDIMLYGGSLKEVLASSYLLSLPEWFSRGLAAYLSEGWSPTMDDRMREMAIRDRLKNPSVYEGEEARLIGQSIFNYIVCTHGKDALAPILSLTRVMRDEKIGIENSIDMAFQVFLANWKAFYIQPLEQLQNYYTLLPDSSIFKSYRNDRKGISRVTLNSSATQLAYVITENGLSRVIVQDLTTKRKKQLCRNGLIMPEYSQRSFMPVLAWKSDHEVAVAVYQKGELQLTLFNLKTKKSEKKSFDGITQILSMSYSADGTMIVFTAATEGKSDLYVYNNQTASLTRITNDLYDEVDACFTGDAQSVYFISNRPEDSIHSVAYRPVNYSIFQYDLIKKPAQARQVYRYGNTTQLQCQAGVLYFLNDERGIRNVNYLSTEGNPVRISNCLTGVTAFSVSDRKKQVYAVSWKHGKLAAYQFAFISDTNYLNIPLTPRVERLYTAHPEYRQAYLYTQAGGSDTSAVELEDFAFTGDKNRKTYPALSAKAHYRGARKYKNLLSTDNVISALAIDPLRGLGIVLQTGMSDLFGNHRIDMGIFILTDFRSSSFYGQYQYLEKRVDFSFRYERYNLYVYNDVVTHVYIRNDCEATVSYPFNPFHRIALSGTYTTTRFSDQSNTSTITFPDTLKHYPGLKLEWMFDNTHTYGLNMSKGTKARVTILQNVALEGKQYNFGRFGIDVRHYQPIHKELIIALRASYGRYFGESRKSYLLGGMDNWIGNKTDNVDAAGSPLNIQYLHNNSDILFARYVTNMRGFNYNAQYGYQYFMFNAEVRFPVILYFTHGSISSNLLRNLQLATFCDVGSAWSGGNPFSTNNSVNTQHIQANPYNITVVNYRSPFLVGIGGGIRTVFLGYYAKADLAWGIKDGSVQPGPKFYFTLGYDF